MLSRINDDTMKTITVFNRQDFRNWLMRNHDNERIVSVICYKKHTKKPSASHKELMEEAICFGWIDTTIKKLDEDRFIRDFTKRNKNSKWSENTLSYAKELIKEKKMMPLGLKYYNEGLKKPPHDFGIPKNPAMPIELKNALDKNKKAKENFTLFPPSLKKQLYRWILRGKLEETRNKRIRKIIDNSKKGGRDIF